MRFSEAHNHKVVSTATAETVGRVDRLLVDPRTQQVAGLLLKKSSGEGNLLAWSQLASFGADAVTVPDVSVLEAPTGRFEELADKHRSVLDKRVLSQRGVELGVVKDVDFDPATGAVRALLTDREELPGERLSEVGSYAVIVTD